jgi:hypothetical protein
MHCCCLLPAAAAAVVTRSCFGCALWCSSLAGSLADSPQKTEKREVEHCDKMEGHSIHRAGSAASAVGSGRKSQAAGGGWRPPEGRPRRALASYWARSTSPGGTTAQRARGVDLGGSTSALVRKAPRGQVSVASVRGPGAGAMMSGQSGAARHTGHWGPVCCCFTRAEWLSNRVMSGCSVFAAARGSLQAQARCHCHCGARASCLAYRCFERRRAMANQAAICCCSLCHLCESVSRKQK